MSNLISGGRSRLLMGAAALAASSVLVVPAPAQAQPDVPLAPPSNICTFPTDRLVVHRSDGKATVVGTNGSTISGMGTARIADGQLIEVDGDRGVVRIMQGD